MNPTLPVDARLPLTRFATAVVLASALLCGAPGARSDDSSAWNLSLSLGLDIIQATKDSRSFTGGFGASYETDRHEVGLSLSGQYRETDGVTDRQTYLGTLNYDFLPNGRWSPFVVLDVRRDLIKGILLRYNVGPGLKWTFYSSDTTKSSLSAAVLYDFERDELIDPDTELAYREETDGAAASLRFKWAADYERLKLAHVTFYLPRFEDFENDYVIQSTTTLDVPISEVLSLNVSVADIYDNLPPAQAERNDFRTTLALTAKFSIPVGDDSADGDGTEASDAAASEGN